MATKNDTEIYSAHNGGKSVVTERFIRTLKIDEFIINRWILYQKMFILIN